MTLKLWRALNNPPATHPIFVRTVLLPRVVKRHRINSASIFIGFVTSMSEFMPTVLIFLMPILLGVCGLIYGIDCAVRVSQQIAFERKNNTYALLALCPPGALAVCWAMCTSLLYQERQFSRLHEIMLISTRIAFTVIIVTLVVVIGITISIVLSSARITLPIITPFINAEALVVLIYSEYIQSTIIGCLVGLIIPTFAVGTTDSFFYSPAVFLLIKIGSYTISLLVGFNLLEGFIQQVGAQSELMNVLLTLVRVVIFVVVQDVVIRLLWRMTIKRTETVPQEAEMALFPPRRR